MEALYIIGEPGVGKSTFVAHLTRGLPHEDGISPFAFRRYDNGVWELGSRVNRDYPGTDTLGMSVQPKVVEFLTGMRPEYLLAEGDRLANRKFFTALVDMGYNLTVVALYGPDVAKRQRALRGSSQDESWLKGRQTKVRRLMEVDPRWTLVVVHAGRSLAEMADLATPIVARLNEAREGVTA